LNLQIESQTTAGQGAANMLTDQRDEAISQLSNLMQVQTSQNPLLKINGLSGVDSSLVTQGSSLQIGVGTDGNGNLGVYVGNNQNSLVTDVQGGQLGALINLHNNLLPQVQQQIDTLAAQIAQQFNAVHSQGVGAGGSFTGLTGWTMPAGTAQSWGAGVTAGNVYVNVTDQATGAMAQSAVAIDPATDDLSSIAGKFGAIAGLSASVVDGQLHIAADSGYKFDFLPALQSTPAASTLSGTSAATLSGNYTGAANDVLTFTVVSGGTVGVDGDVSLEERNSAGELVNTIQVGQGYAAGDAIAAGNGISLAMSAGTLVTGDSFTVNAIANSDTAGLLPAVGMNALFQGNSALDLEVSPDILNDPSQLATSQTPGGTDNLNLQKMLALQNANLPQLNNTNFSDSYNQLMTNTGQQISVLQARQTSMNSMMQQLTQQQSTVSGVDINDETAKLMEYEQLFQSMAKYVSTSEQAVQSLLQVIG
jgi:flagellar hook-associated protein 1 FlgK